MTQNNEIEERIRLVEIELAEIKTRLAKKHEELDGLHSEVNKLTDCINKVTILTEKINTTQNDMWSDLKGTKKQFEDELRSVRDKNDREMKDIQMKFNEVNTTLIEHSTRFESYKDRQKSAYAILGVAVSVLAIIVSIAVKFI